MIIADNVVLDSDNPLKVIGVLDWEMATLGDPLMDLGNSLAYWVQADDDPMFQAMRSPANAFAGHVDAPRGDRILR